MAVYRLWGLLFTSKFFSKHQSKAEMNILLCGGTGSPEGLWVCNFTASTLRFGLSMVAELEISPVPSHGWTASLLLLRRNCCVVHLVAAS